MADSLEAIKKRAAKRGWKIRVNKRLSPSKQAEAARRLLRYRLERD